MDLQNRENFLNKFSGEMGKARAIIPEPMGCTSQYIPN